jgi:hypothetical protein
MIRLTPIVLLTLLGCSSQKTLGGAASCADCPTGYTCGTANGEHVCKSPAGIPLFSTLFVIVMENTSYQTLHDDAATNTPYLHGLLASGAYATNYHGVAHPSLPNYLAMTSGATGTQSDGKPISCDCAPQGNDCASCNILSSCGCEQATTQHVGDQLEAAKKSWRAYAESMGSACALAAAGDYVPRHVPFLYYGNVQGDSARCQNRVVDYGALAGDLAGKTPELVFIAPNLVDDMHGTSSIPNPFGGAANMKAGDTWLAANVPLITASPAYQRGGALVIVWDEDDLSGGLNGSDDPVPLFVMSPFASPGNVASATKADHYALLATIEDGLGLPRLGAAAQAQPLVDFFSAP